MLETLTGIFRIIICRLPRLPWKNFCVWRISRIENHETIPTIHHGESSTAANRVSSFVPEDAGALANLWTPIPHLRSEMSGHHFQFGVWFFFATARSKPCFLHQLPSAFLSGSCERFISAFSVIRARDLPPFFYPTAC